MHFRKFFICGIFSTFHSDDDSADTPDKINFIREANVGENNIIITLNTLFQSSNPNVITNAIATIGENIRVRRFVRYALGEEL